MDTVLCINKHTPAVIRERLPAHFPEGLLVCIDKPYTWTSADVVRKIKFGLQRKLQKKNIKIGHAGTLDPLATGVLVLCIGSATKMSETIQSQEKEYIAQLRFGATTSSFDMEKKIDREYEYRHITRKKLEETLKRFLGPQQQLPPAYSAKMINGMRAYEWMRQGLTVPDLKTSSIEIYELELLHFELPAARVRIRCSKGTYVRALARDIGYDLNSGAYLTQLMRTRSGDFKIEDAMSLESFENIFEN